MRPPRPSPALVAAWLASGCLSSSVRLYDGAALPADEVVRVTTGEGFWGDKTLHLDEVNGVPLWRPSSTLGHMFEVFRVKNDARVLPGEIEVVAGGGQRVRFDGEAGETYRLSLVDSFHDSIPVLVVAREADGAFVVDSEPRMEELKCAPWELDEDWYVVDWRRYRTPHAHVETDVVLYQHRPKPEPLGEWSGATWITSLGFESEPRPGEGLALAADLRLDLELDYSRLSPELVLSTPGTGPRIERFTATAREGGDKVSGFIAVGRCEGLLRGIACVGPGTWALRADRFAERLRRAVGRER